MQNNITSNKLLVNIVYSGFQLSFMVPFGGWDKTCVWVKWGTIYSNPMFGA